ncbi:MAG: LysE family transporter [Candidatus Marinimicrobia bacterium]|nr:LysE family transporter [Candidatus Neomarinimicrobiota bacterium]MCF7903780.1 LysE family transporter [Candidatus Neomarinimicrobiota bacterium]
MIEYIIFGASYAFAAVVQPGPLQVFLISRVTTVGWKRTLPAVFAPLIVDVPIAFLILTVLHQVAGGFEHILRGAGGVVLFYFAYKTYLSWRHSKIEPLSGEIDSSSSLLQAMAVNAFNPNPYIGWSLVLGPMVLEAWTSRPLDAVALLVSFYSILILGTAAFVLLVGTTSFLSPAVRRSLILISAFALAGLGFFSLYAAFGL